MTSLHSLEDIQIFLFEEMFVVNLCNRIIPYPRLQALNEFLISKSDPFLILSQVDPVFTVGLRCLNNDHFKNRGNIPIIKTNRGGQVTFHGPGQLMVYPILNLRHEKLNVKDYISKLEDIVIDACAKIDIKAIKTCDTGVWASKETKIASIGIHISKGKTSHGFALNCNVNLEYFDQIIPCGLSLDKSISSLSKELNRVITPQQMSPLIIDSCSLILSKNVKVLENEQLLKEIENIIY